MRKVYRVGYSTGIEADCDRLDWTGSAPRPLAWSAWYPTLDKARAKPEGGLFDLGDLVPDASLAPGNKLPVILLSHGTGGSPESMGWLGAYLATAGYVVIGAHHHGNTGRERYLPEGFLCWWERAPDLSTLLTILAGQRLFESRLNLSAVHAIGFSLGGHTVLSLAGARTSMARFREWAGTTQGTLTGPREFPDVARRISELMETSRTFRQSWERQSDDFTDPRVASVVAIAAAPPVRSFEPETIQAIRLPALLITGEADIEAPTSTCTDWLLRTNPAFTHVSAGAAVGHYTFLSVPSGPVDPHDAFLFSDNPGIRRAQIHAETAAEIARFLDSH